MIRILLIGGLVFLFAFGLGRGVSLVSGLDGALSRETMLPTNFDIDSIPRLTVRTRAGDRIALAALRGTGGVAFIVFSTKCGMSFAEAQVWERLHESLADAGIPLVGVTTDADWDSVEELKRRANLTFPIAMITPSEARAAGVPGYPTVFAAERSGRVIFASTGALATATFEGWVKAGRVPASRTPAKAG